MDQCFSQFLEIQNFTCKKLQHGEEFVRSTVICSHSQLSMWIFLSFLMKHVLTHEQTICRSNETLDCARPDEDTVNTSRARCLPRTPILSSFLHPKSEAMKSPISDCRRSSSAGPDCSLASSGDGSKRFIDATGAPGSRIDSFRKEEKLVKIEES